MYSCLLHSIRYAIIILLLFPLIAFAQPGVNARSDGSLYIANIAQFLDSCPQADPAIEKIRADFALYRNEIPVNNFHCVAPVSAMPVNIYSDELIALQSLRVLYYMDMGRSGHLPWTTVRLYDWLKQQVDGIHIRDNSGAYCCETIDNTLFFVVGTQNDVTREMDKHWEGISSTIALYAHEARHTQGFFHTSCCGIPGGCDQTYSENALAPYGIQWWLNTAWLNGDINVGLSCLNAQRQQSIRDWHLTSNNSGYIARFCDDSPPFLQAPAVLGGACPQSLVLWQGSIAYSKSQQVTYNNRVYEARIAHTSQTDWPPTLTPSLWQQPTPPDYSEWMTQTHYRVGSKVSFNQKTYQARTEHVSEIQWQPTQTAALWKLVE
ncbi:MAG: hypothetical protein EOO68_25255 [Moraxellaceae bacterium]|nr:MAG: hypothetical protein EOO68_25255 [Moraxellaceae bacterium]